MLHDAAGLTNTLRLVYEGRLPPKPLGLLVAVERARAGEDIRRLATEYGTTARRLIDLTEASDPAGALLGRPIPVLDSETNQRVRRSLGQLLLGRLAEQAFETTFRSNVGPVGLELRDDRSSRGDTDYLVLNGNARRVFRLNIKFFGSSFRNARELVGLDPQDCFALATYKIKGALDKQEREHLPYIFLIVGVYTLTGAVVGAALPEDLTHLSAIVNLTGITPKRAIEDDIVAGLVDHPGAFGAEPIIREYAERLATASWYALSARKAEKLLREKLFERAFALRMRGFARVYRNAELDMHFSLSQDLTPLAQVLRTLREDGVNGLSVRLERGTI